MSTSETHGHDVPNEYDENKCYDVPSPGPIYANLVKRDKALVHSILDDGYLCHVGFIAPEDTSGGCPDRPVVLPTVYGRADETLYLHGSHASHLMAALKPKPENPSPSMWVCVTITHVDALVLARGAFYHGVSYRSAVIYGEASLVYDNKVKKDALEVYSSTRSSLIAGKRCALPAMRSSTWLRS